MSDVSPKLILLKTTRVGWETAMGYPILKGLCKSKLKDGFNNSLLLWLALASMACDCTFVRILVVNSLGYTTGNCVCYPERSDEGGDEGTGQTNESNPPKRTRERTFWVGSWEQRLQFSGDSKLCGQYEHNQIVHIAADILGCCGHPCSCCYCCSHWNEQYSSTFIVLQFTACEWTICSLRIRWRKSLAANVQLKAVTY